MVKVRRKKKGGWQPTRCLDWQDVKEAKHVSKSCSMNCSIDIMPCNGTDIERKRLIQKLSAHLGQSLNRRNRAHIGFTVFEKGGPKNSLLHAHHILRVENEDRDVVKRLANRHPPGVIKVEWLQNATALSTKVNYVTKQRKILSPEFEKRNGHTYQKSPKPVPGRRISYTNAARSIRDAYRSEMNA